jgi:hypothetical protein
LQGSVAAYRLSAAAVAAAAAAVAASVAHYQLNRLLYEFFDNMKGPAHKSLQMVTIYTQRVVMHERHLVYR